MKISNYQQLTTYWENMLAHEYQFLLNLILFHLLKQPPTPSIDQIDISLGK